MKANILNTVIILAVLMAATGCSVSSKSTDQKPVFKKTPVVTTAKATPRDERPKSDLEPADLGPEKPLDATDLRDAVLRDAEAWMGKEVFVKGDYKGYSVSNVKTGKVFSLRITDSSGKEMISCQNRGEAPKDLKTSGKGTIFKGKVAFKDERYKNVGLEPCEFVASNKSAQSGPKPEDVDPDKPFDPKELTEAVAANETEWIGKEVFVRGKTGGGHNKKPDGSVMFYIMNKKNQPQIICRGTKAPGHSGSQVFKGTVEKVTQGMRSDELNLKACEVIE